MKTIYLAILLLVPVVANAQRIDKPNEPYDFYCCVSNSVIYTTVRMGEEKKLYILLKEDGSKVKNEYEVYYKTFMSKGGGSLEVLEMLIHLRKKLHPTMKHIVA